MCVCVTAIEHHWCWRMKLLTGAGTGLENLLLFPSSSPSSSLSHFRCIPREDHWLCACVCVCVSARRVHVCVLPASQHLCVYARRSARTHKALIHAVVCVCLRGYFWWFVKARGSQIPLKSFALFSFLRFRFDAECKRCQQILFVLYVFVWKPTPCVCPLHCNFNAQLVTHLSIFNK